MSFGGLQLQRRKLKSEFFSWINAVMDRPVHHGLIEPAYGKGVSPTGRLCYDCMVLFRMELMRVWYGLSDGEIEEQVNDRLSFSRFVGVGMADDVPDSTTLCRFRGVLVGSGVYDRLLSEVNRRLESRHVLVTSGVIVDAGVTDSPRRPSGQREYEAVRDRHEEEGVDTEARWVRKGGRCHFGYERHTAVNRDGLVIAGETTPTNGSDMKHPVTPLEKANLKQGTPVMAGATIRRRTSRRFPA